VISGHVRVLKVIRRVDVGLVLFDEACFEGACSKQFLARL
jgi:hypothetical protein